eukprot:m.42508 g.42508  ORF g.42508 m.42508 type:complete len:60 (-) comp10697_c0_seq1:18-197(-)
MDSSFVYPICSKTLVADMVVVGSRRKNWTPHEDVCQHHHRPIEPLQKSFHFVSLTPMSK